MIKPIQLIKINRFAAWVLFITILLYFISGYGMTKGIIDRNFSLFLHESVLPFFTITAFLIHASISIRSAFMRWRIWNRLTLFILIIIFIGAFLLFLYWQFFIKKKLYPNPSQNYFQSSQTNTTNNLNQNNALQPQKTFTLSQLAKYNGLNGSPAYVAVDGTVYDLSSVFINGNHFGYSAGQDLTNAFYSHHYSSILARFPIVGVLK